MRSSKSNPSKYVRNYRSISQRQMTTKHSSTLGVDDNDDDDNINDGNYSFIKKTILHEEKTTNSGSGSNSKKQQQQVQQQQQETITMNDKNKSEIKNEIDSDDYEIKEMDRLRKLLRESHSHINQQQQQQSSTIIDSSMIMNNQRIQTIVTTTTTTNKATEDCSNNSNENNKITSKKRKQKSVEELKNNNNDTIDQTNNNHQLQDEEIIRLDIKKENDSNNYIQNDDDMIILANNSSKKKKKNKRSNDNEENSTSSTEKKVVELTENEIKHAKLQYKSLQRRQDQLQKRYEQKQKRILLYTKLQQTALTPSELQLLDKSSEIVKSISTSTSVGTPTATTTASATGDTTTTNTGSSSNNKSNNNTVSATTSVATTTTIVKRKRKLKITNKQLYLQKLYRKECAGVPLTDDEYDMLYRSTNSKDKQFGVLLEEQQQQHVIEGTNMNNKEQVQQSQQQLKKQQEQSQKSQNRKQQLVVTSNNKSKIKTITNDGTHDSDYDDDKSDHNGEPKESTSHITYDDMDVGNQSKPTDDESSDTSIDCDDNDSDQDSDDDDRHNDDDDDDDEDDNNTNNNDDEDDDEEHYKRNSNNNMVDRMEQSSVTTSVSITKTDPSLLAKQMMASFFQLKTNNNTSEVEKQQQQQEQKRIKQEYDDTTQSQNDKKKRYIPSTSIDIKTFRTMKDDTNNTMNSIKNENNNDNTEMEHGTSSNNNNNNNNNNNTVRVIQRPNDVQIKRYELPVNEMEYEIIDSIRTNDVTIICAETGSGKSTQVPQFLYEANFSCSIQEATCTEATTTTAPPKPTSYVIGITQPRRVAAISTAKRVCYEMGYGDGQSIVSVNNKNCKKKQSIKETGSIGTGNSIAYQTRYESAGIGTNTHIKFMTDGILLQEIQSDLLLRKYSVIILDEAHERNLNTDCLIGLLSVAIPLRKQAVAQSNNDGTIQPLKLIIMSATLRIDDFTSKESPLFTESSKTTTKVVTVPGRTHPVTIHHNKITELDNYEDIVFQKTCKIHQKLPPGGILIFLTGKQEIIRMVNRLRRRFAVRKEKKRFTDSSNNITATDDQETSKMMLRDLDDDEEDGDIFQSRDGDDYDNLSKDEEESDADDSNKDTVKREQEQNENGDNDDDGIPKKVIILPLYSLLPSAEQAKIFAPVPDGYRLIVVATNIAETSITIPDVKYVVDSGRQKCRNYNSSTGVASFDIMWISKAAADQRAGRAGRTGPGHCYRIYSSPLYSRQMDPYGLPEVLTRPLEDVVLAMKAMKVSSIAKFPFPTPPDKKQIDAALNLLGNIGCVNVNDIDSDGTDGEATRLGYAVAKLPLGVRCGKMVLVAAQAGVLDYAIVIVSALSEQSPFIRNGQRLTTDDSASDKEDSDSESETNDKSKTKKNPVFRWYHKCGDLLATLHAVGAYTFACKGLSGNELKQSKNTFCEKNGLNTVIMERIQKMREHLCRLAKTRLSYADMTSIAAKTGGYVLEMKPPNVLQEQLLCQSILSGLLDNVAILAPVGSISSDEYKNYHHHPAYSLRTAYLSCTNSNKEPLFIDRNSVLYCKDSRQLPKWVCYNNLIRKRLEDGTSVAIMKGITPIEASWLGHVGTGSRLLSLREPQATPVPIYNTVKDSIQCCILTRYGSHGWEVPSIRVDMYNALQTEYGKKCTSFVSDDTYRWFSRYLLEGIVIPEIKQCTTMYNDNPIIISRSIPVRKISLLVSALANNGIDTLYALRKYWVEKDRKFLFTILSTYWIKKENIQEFKKLWIQIVSKECIAFKK